MKNIKTETIWRYFAFLYYIYMKKTIYRIIFWQAVIATLGSLYYGWFGDPYINYYTWEYFNRANSYEPCQMCWFARVFMYPLIFVIWVALFKKVYDYTVVAILSWLWILLETYQYRFQMTQDSEEVKSVICGLGEWAGSCAAIDVIYRWFVTVPFMCLVAFVVIFLWNMYLYRKRDR